VTKKEFGLQCPTGNAGTCVPDALVTGLCDLNTCLDLKMKVDPKAVRRAVMPTSAVGGDIDNNNFPSIGAAMSYVEGLGCGLELKSVEHGNSQIKMLQKPAGRYLLLVKLEVKGEVGVGDQSGDDGDITTINHALALVIREKDKDGNTERYLSDNTPYQKPLKVEDSDIATPEKAKEVFDRILLQGPNRKDVELLDVQGYKLFQSYRIGLKEDSRKEETQPLVKVKGNGRVTSEAKKRKNRLSKEGKKRRRRERMLKEQSSALAVNP